MESVLSGNGMKQKNTIKLQICIITLRINNYSVHMSNYSLRLPQ